MFSLRGKRVGRFSVMSGSRSLDNFPVVRRRPVVAIIGSAPIGRDLSETIDSCDIVIRINECKVYGGNSGNRTDILCVTNTGAPAHRFIKHKSIAGGGFYPQVSEVWFPRDSAVHKAKALEWDPFFPLSEMDDLWREIAETNSLWTKKLFHFSGFFNISLFNTLICRSRKPFLCPSTGIFTISHVLTDSRFSDFDKYAAGFRYKGWPFHPWDVERELMLEYAGKREDFFLAVETG